MIKKKLGRRKFLKLCGLSPLALVVPSILIAKKLVVTPLILRVDSEGGFLASKDFAAEMLKLSNVGTMIGKPIKIPIGKMRKIRR